MSKVMRFYLMFSLLLCSVGCSGTTLTDSIDPQSARAYVIDSSIGSLEGVRVGMTEDELMDLAYDKSRGLVNLEGDEYLEVQVNLGGDVFVDCLFHDSELYQFSTVSRLVQDENGLGVGATLLQLKEKYPNGRLLVGDEDGRFASFLSGSKVLFFLGKDGFDDLCFDAQAQECEYNDRKVTVEKVIVSKHGS
ncbi:hypothetical protein OS187_13100 [Xanthomonadaceae bacterium JHOS43]|nr:hypothetical protein [Xanthomonadaceae bacterium JHOS43]